MTAEKASTLRLLREGMGRTVNVLEARDSDSFHEMRAHLPDSSESDAIPVLFLLSSLAFLEAGPAVDDRPEVPGHEEEDQFMDVDGWTPADFLSHLRLERGTLTLTLEWVRGRAVFTTLSFSPKGDLTIRTQGRGKSARRWIAYVQGRSHLQEV